MMPLKFPWPDSRLSPNGRGDRRGLTAQRQAARDLSYVLTKEAGLTIRPVLISLGLYLCPPNHRRRDIDNVYSNFKSYQDGIFRALGLDDSLIKRVEIEWGEVEKDGAVYVQIVELEAKAKNGVN